MSDYCAWCGKELPLTRRDPKRYRKDDGVVSKSIEAALCSGCEEGAFREKPPWKIEESKGG